MKPSPYTPLAALYAWLLFLVAGAVCGLLLFLTVYLYVASTGAAAFDGVGPLKAFVAGGAVAGSLLGAVRISLLSTRHAASSDGS